MSGLYPPTKTARFTVVSGNLRKAVASIVVVCLALVFTSQSAFTQEKRKNESPQRVTTNEGTKENPVPEEKVNPTAIQEEEKEAEDPIELKGTRKPITINTQVASSSGDGFIYRINRGDKEIFSQQVLPATDNPSVNKSLAERQAQVALSTYLKNPKYSEAELKSEIHYQNQVTAQSIASHGNINQNTLAVCTYNGTVQNGDPQVLGRINRNGVVSSCAAPKTCPGNFNPTTSYNYDTHTLVNVSSSTQCITVNATSNTTGQLIHIVAYLGSFNPADHCQNYLADPGSSTTPGTNFSFNLAAGATVVFVVYNPNAPTTTTDYTITVDNCPTLSCQPVVITGQPVNSAVCENTNTSFSVTATPAGLTYNWQEDRGSGFVYLTNGGVYSGVNTATLNLTGVTASMNGYRYRCVVICPDGGLPEISNDATLTVLPAPAPPIIVPTAATICPGGIVPINLIVPQYEITFSGTGPIELPAVPTTSGIANPYPATISVSGLPPGATVKSVQINGISHTWSNDIDILLQSPTSTNVVLMSDVGGSGILNNVNYSFNDAGPAMSTATGNPSGTYKPTNSGSTDTYAAPGPGSVSQASPSIASFGSGNLNGTWNLFAVDDASGDFGSISDWSITFTIPDNPTFVSTDIITIPAGAPGTSSGIADPYPSNLLVTGLPVVGATVKSVTITDINHTWSGDVEILLQSPTGTNVILMSDIGGSGDFVNHTYTFDDAAAGTMTGNPPTSGTWQPTNVGTPDDFPAPGPGIISQATPSLSMFGSGDHNGTWKLFVYDNAAGDVGEITGGWSISFNTPPAGPTMATFSPQAGLFLDAGATIPYAGTLESTVYASPAAPGVYNYQATVSNGTCNSLPTNIVITVNAPPSITVHPSSTPASCEGDTRTFTVSATGAGLTYQWQVDMGGGFVNLTNTAPYSGVTTATLTINPVSLAMNGYQYRCIVNGTCPPSQTSNAATLTVNPLPTVTVGPAGQCSPVTLTATGGDTYSWSPAGGLSATTGATVTATTSVNTVYTVTGTITATGCSSSATVNVVGTPTAPTIAPSAPIICLGSSALLQVSGVQSFANPAAIAVPGTGTSGPASPYPSTINVSGLASSGVTVKSVTINNFSHTWPDDVDVVLQSPTGTNVVIMSDAGGSASATGQTFTFDDAAATTLADGAFNPSGTYKPSNFGATDTWPAPGPGSITQASPALSMFGSGNQNGTWRLFIHDQFAGDEGDITGGWSITFNTGASTVTFSPTTGLFTDAGLTTPYTGTQVTQVYASPATTTTYTAVASNSGPGPNTQTFTYSGSTIEVPAVPTTSGISNPYPAMVSVTGIPVGATVKSVTLNGFSHTWPDDVDVLLQSPTGANVILMSDAGGSTDATGQDFTFDDGAASNLADGAFNPSGLYKPTNYITPDAFAAPGPGSVSQASPALSLFGNGDHNGTWNLFIVDDAGGDIGSLTGWSITFAIPTICTGPATDVTVTVHNPVVFTQHPQNRTVCENDNVSFTVAATGTIQTYQWQVSTNGGSTWTNIAGATTATLTLNAVTPSMNNNQYRCVLSSTGCGSFFSNAGILTVNPLPTVTLTETPSGQLQLRPGMLTTLNVSSSPAAVSYAWSVNGSLQSGITSSSYVVDAYHLGTYTVEVTDVNGCKNTSNAKTLTALPTNNLFIYPNPTSGAYYITYYTPQVGGQYTISVFDAKGRRIVEKSVVSSAPYTRFDFDASKLAAGVYFVELRDYSGNRLGDGRLVVIR